jgi:hypothetical protein
MSEESLRGEAVYMKHTFFLDECMPTYSAAQRDVLPLPAFSFIPFTKAWLLRKILTHQRF